MQDVKNRKKAVIPKKQTEKEPELRPEYVAKIRRIEKENKKPIKYNF
jgi:hypothetical protein